MYGMNLESTQDYIHTDNLLFNTIINNKIQYAKSEKSSYLPALIKN